MADQSLRQPSASGQEDDHSIAVPLADLADSSWVARHLGKLAKQWDQDLEQALELIQLILSALASLAGSRIW